MRSSVPSFLIFALALALFIIGQFLRSRSLQEDRLPFLPSPEDGLLGDGIQEALTRLDEDRDRFALPADALARSLESGSSLRESDIDQLLGNRSELERRSGFSYFDTNRNRFITSNLGLDKRHHFQNSFLVGYKPFDVSETWMPHSVISMRMRYQFDKDQFPGYEELWLSSYQAFQNGRGDCEDHSLALADWLIEMGEDARVATGDLNGEGHAWVVVIREAGTFILEATEKRRSRVWSAYPLADLAIGYAPSEMFNRDTYWINQDHAKRTDYTGPHWKPVARIER